MKIRLKCRYCGSTSVGKDAWASWDEGMQEWVHGGTYDTGFCNDCGREQDDFDEEELP
jgi:hypothetical protein